VQHKCDLSRSITYYLEVVCILAIFGKTVLNMELEGNTIDEIDQSVDSFKTSLTHLLAQFGAPDSLRI
jgi:RNA 3'-terminal phosphate cyclase-like protein